MFTHKQPTDRFALTDSYIFIGSHPINWTLPCHATAMVLRLLQGITHERVESQFLMIQQVEKGIRVCSILVNAELYR